MDTPPQADDDAPVRFLFLDDMEERHKAFRANAPHDAVVTYVHTAREAIEALESGVVWDQVFLDHDLSLDDIMAEPGSKTKEPSGMTVVDHIVGMETPPAWVVVHSCNGPAAGEMCRRLREKPGVDRVNQLPFPNLIHLMRINNTVDP